jgi:hypothetical protein
LENLGFDGRIILKWFSKKQNRPVMIWTGFIWLRIGPSFGLLKNTVMNVQVP